MDWARAKSIILVLLIFFNIFLLSRVISFANEQNIPRITLQNTISILEKRGVGLECEIPRENSDKQRLIYGNVDYNKDMLIKKLIGNPDKTVDSADGSKTYENTGRMLIFYSDGLITYTDKSPSLHINAKEKDIRRFLEGTGLVNSSYILDDCSNKQGKGVVFNFIQKYKGCLVFDNYIKIIVTGKGVTYIETRSRQIKGLSPDKVSDISAAYQVLLGNFDGSRKVVITGIDMGYKNAGSQEQVNIESSEQPPVWRIKLKGSNMPLYFRTSDGKEIK